MIKLLVPMDGSESALRAVNYVVKLANANVPLSVVLLYVHYEPVNLGDVSPRVTPEGIVAIQQEYADSALAEAENILRNANIESRRELRVADDIAPVIVKCADDSGCDGIVMGTHGASALANALVGSTATKVVQRAKVPVTVVK